MSECTNKEIGRLLHGYEIGILSESDCEKFETHLLECEHCHNLLLEFEKQAELLRSSPKAKVVIDDILSEKEKRESFWARLWNHLWPKTHFILKPAITYLIIIVLAVPAYYGLKREPAPAIEEIRQTIHLSPIRIAAQALKKGLGDNGLLTFRFDNYYPGNPYKVMIESEDGIIIYDNADFHSFDQRSIGNLSLDISGMKAGKYHMVISDTQADSPQVIQEYWFRIEE